MSSAHSHWMIEEACRNAYPARELLLGGWLLRAAGGRSRRTNSVNPLPFGPRDPSAVVTFAEAIYAGLGQRLVFRVPEPAGEIDAALDQLGFATAGETLTLWADTADFPEQDGAVVLQPAPDLPWFDAWSALNPDATPADRAAFQASLAAILLPARYACRFVGREPAALAFGVLDRGLLIVEAVVTGARFRRQGHARSVLAALAGWAEASGATGACLQVASDNTAALSLYRTAGFNKVLYGYHYRVAPALT